MSTSTDGGKTSENTDRRHRPRRAVAQQIQWPVDTDSDQPSPCSSTSWSPPRSRRSLSPLSVGSRRSRSPLSVGSPRVQSSVGSPPRPSSPRSFFDSPLVEYECAECSEAFRTKAEVRRHMKQSPNCGGRALSAFQHKCDDCGMGFAHQSDVDMHRSKDHGAQRREEDHGRPQHEGRQRPYACRMCDYPGRRFDRAEQLAKHLRRKHGRPDLECELCGLQFGRRTDLNRHHRAVHLRQRPHQCHECGQRFAQKSNMMEHRRTVHAAQPVLPFRCPLCDRRFSRRHNMAVHVRAVHDAQKRYKCPSCPRSYDQQAALDRHYAVLHAPPTDGLPLFMCPVCGKRFSQKSNLTVHRRLHDAIQLLFACPVCHRTYTRKAALDKHACRPVEA